jgi:hypothetical protein
MLDNIREFDLENTAIFVEPYLFYSYRHFMFYLPAYRIYNVDYRISELGEIRKTFWGLEKETFVSDEIFLPKTIEKFVTPLILSKKRAEYLNLHNIEGITVRSLANTNFHLLSGKINLITILYPELRINPSHVENNQSKSDR